MHGTSNVHRIENFIKKNQPRMAFELCDAILGNAGLEKESQIELLTLRAKCQMDLKRFYESRVDLEKARSLNQFNEKVCSTKNSRKNILVYCPFSFGTTSTVYLGNLHNPKMCDFQTVTHHP